MPDHWQCWRNVCHPADWRESPVFRGRFPERSFFLSLSLSSSRKPPDLELTETAACEQCQAFSAIPKLANAKRMRFYEALAIMLRQFSSRTLKAHRILDRSSFEVKCAHGVACLRKHDRRRRRRNRRQERRSLQEAPQIKQQQTPNSRLKIIDFT